MSRHGVNKMPEYWCWSAMVQRCTNPKDKRWDRYGGRGISVCDRWRVFAHFIEDMGQRPDGMTLERKDNDAGYSPANCVWAPPSAQAKNKGIYRNNRSGVTGVKIRPDTGKYRAEIGVNGAQIRLGQFDSLHEAEAARKAAEAIYWNKPEHAPA